MRATLEDTRTIAQELKRNSRIHGVELFGSVLRNGSGHDIDFILLVDDDIAQTWWADIPEDIRVKVGTHLLPLQRCVKKFAPHIEELFMRTRKSRRVQRASELLDLDIVRLCDAHKFGTKLDLYLLPVNWRKEKKADLSVLYKTADMLKRDKNTREFLERVAQVAVRLV